MLDLPLPDPESAFTILPGRTLSGTVEGLFAAFGGHFETSPVATLELGFDGIAGDVHGGQTRRSGGREPWYRRGTEIRNERQISLVSADELDLVAGRMGVAEIHAEWVGANLRIGGIAHLSMLPAGTLLFFAGGATIKIDAQNRPCRIAGRQVASRAAMEDVEAGALAFVTAAKRLRGLVGWVEKPGVVRTGENVKARLPEQWIYR